IQYLAASEESGVLEEEERDMIHSIFQFGDLDVQQVMVPRVEMVSVDETATLEDAMRTAIESGHSRLPVHSGDRDHIVGILHAKDLIRQLGTNGGTQLRTVAESELMRPVQFVHGSKPISALFSEMKAHKFHIAIVVDEYGGTDGLVTIEDLLETLVGTDIMDESDIEEPLFHFDKAGCLVVDGHLPLHEFTELIDWEIPENGVDTVGGLVYIALGRVPEPGEEVDLGGLTAQVLVVDENRIKELKLVDAPLTAEARELLLQQNPEAAAQLSALNPPDMDEVPEL
ncbi:MAG TPA: hemolysin family protein, partial [bacterium]|nr:hemolysin family protein [bacterium]